MARPWTRITKSPWVVRVGGPNGPLNNSNFVDTLKSQGTRDDIVLGNHRDPLPYSFNYNTRAGDPFSEGMFSNYWSKCGYIAANPEVNAAFDTALYNACVSKLYEKVRGTLDLAVAVAQTRETKRMFHLWDKLDDFARAKSPRDWNRLISGSYLEFQYGWRPLLSDIHAAADTWMNRTDNIVSTILAKAGYRNFKAGTRGASSLCTFMPNNFPMKYHSESKRTCRIECVMDISRVSRGSQWTSYNPLSVAWELVPYSFVIDWFYDIGSYLRDYESALLYSGLPVSKLCVSQYAFEKLVYPPQTSRQGANYFKTVLGYVEVGARYQRTTPLQLPKPLRPTFNVGLSSQRLANLAALMAQRIGVKPRARPYPPRSTLVRDLKPRDKYPDWRDSVWDEVGRT